MLYSVHNPTSPKKTELQQDEVEASSILVSLANHQYSTSNKKEKTKSMSIHNLLESDHRVGSRELSHPVSPPCALNERMQLSPENYIGHTMQPKAQMTIQHNQESQCQPPAHQPNQHCRMTREHEYYHSPPNASMDYSKHYTRMKCNPKIRRNALQAYISYKTFTDIKRRRMGTAMHKHNIAPPASSPYNNNALIKPDPHASHYKHHPRQHQLASPPYYHQHYSQQSPPYHRKHNQQQQYRANQQFQQLLSPPPPSPTQIISVQAKPPLSSTSCSPLEDRMPSPTTSKVIVDQPLTAFLRHNRSLVTKTSPPPLAPQQYQDQHYYQADNIPLSPPIPRRYNGNRR
ncbi:hypothetical protein [Parasitella parasitica]|uniref:Uncharacterized protein n=1 Tax=Parasitella parasitica TaxID=35722 RepID=A0A0B7NLC5_9FUNG|nr:hypothetical protein [Parasitella parasitica]